MASPTQGFYSTPAFELFRRGLVTETIKKFRGINAYQTFAQLGPEWALDLLNVIIGSDGALHKFRLPQVISPNLGFASGPQTFIDFQQANGTRQVAAFFSDGSFEIFTNDMTANTLIEKNALNTGLWSLAVLKNQLFGTNGQRMRKWLGTPITLSSWQNVGIVAPTVAPIVGRMAGTTALTRTSNVVTFNAGGLVLAVGDTVIISNSTDPSFNGSFKLTAAGANPTYAQTAANATTTARVLAPAGDQFSGITISTAVRSSGVTTITVTVLAPLNVNIGTSLTIAGVTDTSFNGTFTLTNVFQDGGGTHYQYSQPGQPDSSSSGGTISGGITVITGISFAYAWVNPITGNYSNVSPASVSTGPLTNRLLQVWCQTTLDAQVPQNSTGIALFTTLDGGGDYFFDADVLPNTVSVVIGPDGQSDYSILPVSLPPTQAALDTTRRGPLINNPPPQCQFLVVGQGRLFGFNVAGAPQDVVYSGYEQILVGNPPECFPPNNRLRLSIGAESVSGGGVLQNGVVAFSQTGKMFMFRGNIQDISVTVPVIFTQYLQELPWQLGCLSNWSIQSTPYGLIWLAADKTVQFFDGSNQPQDISKPFYPILRTITAGTENQVVSAYFNWLDRDWYVLSVATGGSLTNNRLFFWSLDREVGEIEMFVSDVQADYVTAVTTSKLQRQLIIAQSGQLKNLPASQDTRGGLVSDLTIIPPTSGQMNAFWRGGYFGNQSPQRMKSFRWGRLITDQGSFLVQHRLVDDDSKTFLAPEIRGPYQVNGSRFGIGRKAKRCSVEIDFPVQDVSANVIEMQVASVPTADR